MVSIVIGAFLLIWAAILLFKSLWTVDAGTVEAVYTFGRLTRRLLPGLNILIPFIERTEVFSSQTHQIQLPDETPNIDRESDVMPPGKKPPYRITLKSKGEARFYKLKRDYQAKPGDKTLDAWELLSLKEMKERYPDEAEALEIDGIHGPITGEAIVVVEWQLEGTMKNVRRFVENIEPADGRSREEEVRKRMDDMCDRALQETMGIVTYGNAEENRALFSQLLKERLEILVGEVRLPDGSEVDKPWGVHIRDAYIKELQPGRRVNTARAIASAAINQRQADLTVARTKADATIMQGEAEKEADIARAEAKAEGVRLMKEQVSDDTGRFVATLDVAARVIPTANTVIVPAGEMSAIASVLALGQKMLKPGEPPSGQK